MLQLLNRNQTRFTHRARRSQLHPEDFYLDLAGLLGELMTFTEPSRLPCPLDVYDHHDLTKTFKTLLPEVKRALHTVLSPRAVNLPLHLRDGIWQADVHDSELLQSATFVLAVAANMPVDQIQRQFIQQSKISSPEKIRNMVSVQIPGIPLRALMVAPASFPTIPGSAISNSTRAAGPDRNGCRRGRCTACIRQFPGSEHATVGDKRVRRWMRGHCLCHHLPDTTKKPARLPSRASWQQPESDDRRGDAATRYGNAPFHHEQPDDAGASFAQVVTDVQAVEQLLQEQGYEPGVIISFRYILCTFIDEAALGNGWSNKNEWIKQSLLVHFHNEARGGEKVFILLERLIREPKRYRDLLEFLWLCFSLGFRGRYKVAVQDQGNLSRSTAVCTTFCINCAAMPLSRCYTGQKPGAGVISSSVA